MNINCEMTKPNFTANASHAIIAGFYDNQGNLQAKETRKIASDLIKETETEFYIDGENARNIKEYFFNLFKVNLGEIKPSSIRFFLYEYIPFDDDKEVRGFVYQISIN